MAHTRSALSPMSLPKFAYGKLPGSSGSTWIVLDLEEWPTFHPPRSRTICVQPGKYWHCFEGNLGETAKRRGGARMGLSNLELKLKLKPMWFVPNRFLSPLHFPSDDQCCDGLICVCSESSPSLRVSLPYHNFCCRLLPVPSAVADVCIADICSTYYQLYIWKVLSVINSRHHTLQVL